MMSEQVWHSFRKRREESILSPMGFLALTSVTWFTPGSDEVLKTLPGVPGEWEALPVGQSGVLLRANKEDNLIVDGVLVDGQVHVRGSDDETPSVVEFGSNVQVRVFRSKGLYGVRVWNQEALQPSQYGGIDVFGYNPNMIFEAQYDEVNKIVNLTCKDRAYRLETIPAGAHVQIVFADRTTDVSTYSAGRFLFVAPAVDGRVLLDFNMAVVPPCAFNYAFNCPRPPEQNKLDIAIEAGEKNVLSLGGGVFEPQL